MTTVVLVQQGGTGANSAAAARAALSVPSSSDVVSKTGDTMTGELTVSVASSANAVRITQTGSGNALVVEDSANPDASPFIIDAGGQLIQGYTTAINNWNLAPDTFALHSSSSNARPSTGLYNWSTNTARVGTFAMYKSISGVVGTNSALTTLGQQFGRIAFCGDDGTSFIRGAEIIAYVDGTVGANSMPGKLDFRTTAAGASSPTQRMVIDANGNIGIGISSPTANLHLIGSANVTGNAIFSGGNLFVDAVGNNVGIGTTSPTANLHVTGTIKDTPIVSITGNQTYADNAAGRVIFSNTTSAVTVTIAAAATAGFSYTVIRGNTGNVTIANSGVTRLNSASITTMNLNQYGAATVVYTATNQVIVFGDFVA